MTPTLKIILLYGAGIWGLVSLVLLVALFRAARRSGPEMITTEEVRPRWRGFRRKKKCGEPGGWDPLQR